MTLTVNILEEWNRTIDAGLKTYRLRMAVASTDISSWDNECANAGKVFVEETAFGKKQAYDTTSTGTDNTVEFLFITAPDGLPNPLTLILKNYNREQISYGTFPWYRVEVEGYEEA